MGRLLLLLVFWLVGGLLVTAAEPKLPPGWLPVQPLTDEPAWGDVRKIDDKIHLYLPPGVKNCRGIFVCFVFHSADPRELARLWKFALVTVPWPFEYDLGHNDKRNGRFKIGHPVGNTQHLLDYLQVAAEKTKHPELAVAPIVGWVGQNGSHIGSDLHQRAPKRVVAWCDSFHNSLVKYPEFTAQVPFAYAWETNANDRNEREKLRSASPVDFAHQATPPSDLKCRATTYGFPHGIYSKFNFFAAYLDRCIQLRLPATPPPPGVATELKPIDRLAGWVGDFNPVSEFPPIARATEAKGFVTPSWLPDESMAWAWRAYHSANNTLKLTSPVLEYRKKEGKWGGPECGLGYQGELSAQKNYRLSAESKTDFTKVVFHDGQQVLATVDKAPWQVDDIKLQPGLRVLFAVGTKADGQQCCSRPGFVIVK